MSHAPGVPVAPLYIGRPKPLLFEARYQLIGYPVCIHHQASIHQTGTLSATADRSVSLGNYGQPTTLNAFASVPRATDLNQTTPRKLNHAIHLAAVSQIRNDTPCRVYHDKKRNEGKTKEEEEALRALKRRVSDAVYGQLTAQQIKGPGDTQERLIARVAGFAS